MSAHNLLEELLVAEFEVKDPGDAGAIVVTKGIQHVPLTTGASAETRTLAVPTDAGTVLILVLVTDGGGDLTLTVASGYNAAATTDIVFGDAGDWVALVAVQTAAATYRWRVLNSEGVGLAVATGNQTVGGALNVTGALTVGGAAAIAGSLTASGDLSLSGVVAGGASAYTGGSAASVAQQITTRTAFISSNEGFVKLPAVQNGLEVQVINVVGTTAAITAANTTAEINGAQSLALATSGGAGYNPRCICDGTKWWTA